MGKSKAKQLNWEEERQRKLKLNQKNCKHKFKTFQLLDFLNDEVLYEAVCLRCGYNQA